MPKPPAPGMNAKGVGGIKKKYLIVGGVGAAVLGIMYYRRQAAAAAPVDPTATDPTAATDPYTTDYSGATGYGTGAGGAYGPVAPDTSVDSASIAAQAAETAAQSEADTATALSDLAGAFSAPVETNQDWQRSAIHALEEHGYTAAQARHAVAAYLAGAPLTAVQAHTIESAVGIVGPPPSSPPPISITNPHNNNAGNKKTRGQKTSGQSSKTHNKALAAQPKPIVVAGKKFNLGGFGVLKPAKKAVPARKAAPAPAKKHH